MSLFGGADPRDELIKVMREEIAYLRQKLDERDQEVLALTNASVFRMLHPYENAPTAGESVRSVFEDRSTPYKPEFTLGEVKEKFGSDS
jgi:hypothetical protein